MIPGLVVGGEIVVGVLAVVDAVGAGVEIVAAVGPGVLEAEITGELGVGGPGHGVAAAGEASLHGPMIVELGCAVDSSLGVAVDGVKDGMRVAVVIGCELRFDVGQ